ncbi:hypothetical protein Tco_0156560 [Tanacetum coccineum]
MSSHLLENHLLPNGILALGEAQLRPIHQLYFHGLHIHNHRHSSRFLGFMIHKAASIDSMFTRDPLTQVPQYTSTNTRSEDVESLCETYEWIDITLSASSLEVASFFFINSDLDTTGQFLLQVPNFTTLETDGVPYAGLSFLGGWRIFKGLASSLGSGYFMQLKQCMNSYTSLPQAVQWKFCTKQVASIVSSSIQPLQNMTLVNYIGELVSPDEKLPWAQYHIRKGFVALEKLLAMHAGKYATEMNIFLHKLYISKANNKHTRKISSPVAYFPACIANSFSRAAEVIT